MHKTIKDIRYGARRLLRSPAFSLAAVLTLSLGIAANATIFTVVERVVLRPLPYPDSDRIVWLDHTAPGLDLPEGLGLSQGLFEYYRNNARSFESLAILRESSFTMTGEGAAERLRGISSTASLPEALRVHPAMGRWFTEDEAQDDERVVVLSDGLWRRSFGADPAILGRTVMINGRSHEIIGVMPATFAFPGPEYELWEPERLDEEQVQTVGGFNYRSIARLRDGASVATVKAELDGLIAGLKEAFPSDPVTQQALDAAQLASLTSLLKDHTVKPVRRTLWILLGMVGLVLLIACANVANLFLVRSEARQREVAIRRALGAGTPGLVRYFLSESGVLAAAGGVIGLGLTWVGVRGLVGFGPDNLPRLHEVTIDGGVIAFTALLSVIAGIAFGSIPLLRRSGPLATSLREGGRSATAGRGRFRARSLLMGGQVALAFVLLVGCGLMIRSFMHLRAVDPGFDSEGVLTFDVALSGTDFPDRTSAAAFHAALLERLRALPGVQSAAAVSCLPLTGSCWGDPLRVQGRAVQPGELPPIVQIRRSSPGYLETMGIPLLQGRDVTEAEGLQRANVALISRTLAREYFGDEDPIGQQISYYFGEGDDPADVPWFTVVGVIADTPVDELAESRVFGIAYMPIIGQIENVGSGIHQMAFALKTSLDPIALASAARAAAADLSENVAVANLRSMEMIVADATARIAFTMILLVIAATVALLLGAIGIYGVIGYVVGQRTAEIGVRLALGASPTDVSGMVLKQGGSVVAAGLIAGLAGALLLTRLMEALLFDVTTSDPVTYAAVTAFLLAVAGLASWLPARRAARLDPAMALRAEQA
jgi:putative ABC transport system permease protein